LSSPSHSQAVAAAWLPASSQLIAVAVATLDLTDILVENGQETAAGLTVSEAWCLVSQMERADAGPVSCKA